MSAQEDTSPEQPAAGQNALHHAASDQTGSERTTIKLPAVAADDAHAGRPGGARSVSYSRSIASRILNPSHMNGLGRLHGGVLMQWIDEIAGVASLRHCSEPIATASVDPVSFIGPAYTGDVVTVDARVTYIGRTSLEVRVDSYIDDRQNNKKKLINQAYLTEVCMGEGDIPQPINFDLLLEDERDLQEWNAARERMEHRKLRRKAKFFSPEFTGEV